MRAHNQGSNGSSNNLPRYPPLINFRMLCIGGQGTVRNKRKIDA